MLAKPSARRSAFIAGLCGFFVLSATQTYSSAAQVGLQPGARIRLLESRSLGTTGRLLAVGQDSLLYSPYQSNEVRVVPLASLRSLEYSLGGNAGQTAIRGGAIGSALGFLAVGLVKIADRQEDAKLGWALAGGVGGSLTGLLIGGLAGKERWQSVPVPAGADVLPPPEVRAQLPVSMQLDSVPQGSPAQFRLFDGQRHSGSYAGHDAAYARLQGDSLLLLPITSIRQIALREKATITYGKRGLLIGALGGAIAMGVIAWSDNECSGSCITGRDMMGLAVGMGTLLGGATGLLAGTLIGTTTNRWQVQHW